MFFMQTLFFFHLQSSQYFLSESRDRKLSYISNDMTVFYQLETVCVQSFIYLINILLCNHQGGFFANRCSFLSNCLFCKLATSQRKFVCMPRRCIAEPYSALRTTNLCFSSHPSLYLREVFIILDALFHILHFTFQVNLGDGE